MRRERKKKMFCICRMKVKPVDDYAKREEASRAHFIGRLRFCSFSSLSLASSERLIQIIIEKWIYI